MSKAESENDGVKNGTISVIDGDKRIYYYGYWIRHYEPPAETLSAKKNLIAGLTRRTFHHTESGINTPGENLDLARRFYEQADNDEEKRVSGAMLAGALFNRATDIFTTIVDLEDKGVHISTENELMKECSECLEEAMELGKMVRHISGVEGIDELWGEPLKAFAMPLHQFYVTRYVKISLTMRDIDQIIERLRGCLSGYPLFDEFWTVLDNISHYAKLNSETIKRDPHWFEIWPKFVTNSEKVDSLIGQIHEDQGIEMTPVIAEGCKLIETAKNLITYISGARVPMPDTTRRFFETCDNFQLRFNSTDGNDNDE